MAGLDFKATLDNADFKNKLMEMQTSLAKVSQEVATQGANMENTFNGVRGSVMDLAAQFGIGFGAVQFIKQVAQVRGQFQALEQSFKTLLRSEEEANDLMNELTRTAATTPFDLQGVAGGAKQLLAYGVAAKDVNKTLVELGDIASGMGLSLSYITQLYGTTISKESMDTMDLKQFKGQGIAIDEAIASVMKVEKQDVPALISQHKVTSDIVKAAISSMAGEDGQFGGMMIQQSKTILGQISNLEDAVDMMFNNIGKQTEGVISDTISAATYIVENYEAIGKQITELVAAYGAYKAALISITAYQGSGAKAELEMLRELTKGVEEQGDAELEALVKKGALTEAEAAEIIALRAEIEAKEAEAKATFDMARESKAAANAKVIEAEKTLEAAKAAQMAANSRYDSLKAAAASADAEIEEDLARELNAAAANKEAAAQAVANAEKEVSIARTEQVAAGERVEVAQRNLNTASIQRQTIAQRAHANMTNFLATAQRGLKKALDMTGLSMLANPYVAAAAAIAAVGYAIYKVTTYTSDYELAVKRLNDARIEEQEKVSEEQKKLDGLINTLKKLDKNSEEYKTTKQKLIDGYGKYADNLSDEIDKTTDLVNVHRMLAQAIQDEADVKAYNAEKSEIENQYMENRTSTMKDVYNDIKQYFDGDIAQTNAFYEKLQKAMKDGTLKVQNTTIAGGVSGSEIIADRNNQNAKEVEDVLNTINKSLREKVARGTGSTLVARIGKLFSLIEDRDAELKEAQHIFNITDEKLKRVDTIASKTTTDSMSDMDSVSKSAITGLADIIKKIREKEAELLKVQNDFKNGIKHKDVLGQKDIFYTQEDVDDAIKALNEVKSAYEKATNIKWDDRYKNAQNLTAAKEAGILLSEEAEADLIKKAQEQQWAIQQAEIDVMEDGFEKRKAQRDLNNAKQLQAIYDAGEEEKKALIESRRKAFEQAEDEAEKEAISKGDKNHKRKVFSTIGYRDSDEYKQQAAEIDKQTTASYERLQNAQYISDSKAARKDLDDRKQYYAQYIAIQKSFVAQEDALNKQRTTGELSQSEYETMVADAKNVREKALQDAGYTEETLKGQAESLGSVINTILFASGSDVIKKMEEAISMLSTAEDEGNQELIASLQSQLEVMRKRVAELQQQGKLKDPTSFTKAWAKYGSAVQGVTRQVTGLADAFTDGESKAVEAISSIADELFEITNAVNDIVALTAKGIDAEVELVDESAEGMKATAKAGSETMQTIEKASIILAIIAAAYQIVMKIRSLIKDSDEKWAEENNRQQEYNKLTTAANEYEKAVLDAQHAEENWFSSTGIQKLGQDWESAQTALDAYYDKYNEQQLKYKNQYGGRADGTTYMMDVMKGTSQYTNAANNLYIETKAGKKGFLGIGRKSQQTQNLSDWAKQNLDMDLFDDEGMINGEAAKVILDQYGDKLQGETKATIEELLKNKEEVDKAMEQMQGYVSEMYSPLVDNMTDAIMNWLDTGEDVMDSFEDYAGNTFRNIAQDMIKQLVTDMVFKDAQEKYMQAYKDYAAGTYGEVGSEDALTKLAQETTAISGEVKDNLALNVEGFKTFAQTLSDASKEIGVDISNVNQDQEATYGGYETMSEETGTELSGRFSAMYIVQSEHLALAQAMAMAIEGAYSVITMNNGILEDIRALHVQSNDYLNTIAQMTRNIYNSWNDKIDQIERHTKTLE